MIHLLALGHAVITVGATRLTSASETLFAAALLFVSEAGRPLPRSRVLDLLWPDATRQQATHRLRQTIYRLNALGAALRADRGQIVLPAHAAQSDCAEVLDGGATTDPERVARLVQGPYLHGYAPHFSAPFTAWLEHQRDVAGAGLLRVLIAALAAKRRQHDWAAVESLAARCLMLDPLNEEATLAIAEAAAVHGSKARALDILDGYLGELGPDAGDIRLPATLLRRRIAERYHADPPDRCAAPQIGRDEEMRELGRALRGLRASRGAMRIIRGEEGIGKTRLVTEVARLAQLDGAAIVRVECQPGDAQRQLSAFADMVPRLRALRGAIAVGESSTRCFDLLARCPTVADGGLPPGAASDPRLTDLRAALLDLLDAVAAEQPLVLIIENGQWLDDASWQLVRVLDQWVIERPVLILLTSRGGVPDAWLAAGGPCSAPLGLTPLTDAASHRLIEFLLTGTGCQVDPTFADWCVLQAGGNPLYLTQLARHAEHDGRRFRAPVTLEGVVGRRLASVSPTAIRVLQAAAVLGRWSSADRVEELLGAARLALLGSFDELAAGGLIDIEHGAIAVRHQLVAEAALARLSDPGRHLLHRRAAELLEAAHTGARRATLLRECAEHWRLAGEPERAIERLTAGARQLAAAGMPNDAARLHERAAQLAATPEARLPHVASRAHALFHAAQWDTYLRAASEAEVLRQRALPDATGHDDTELELALAKWRTGHDRRELLSDALRCAAAGDAPARHRVRAATWSLMLADNLCDQRAARIVLAAVSALVQSAGDDDRTATHFRMVYHAAFGDPAEGLRVARTLVRVLHDQPDSGYASRQLSHAAAALRLCGASPLEARDAAAAALGIAERLGIAAYAAPAVNQIMLACLAAGDWTGAGAWFRKARALIDPTADVTGRATTLSAGAEIALREGRLDDAQRLIEESERTAEAASSLRGDMRYLSFRWRLQLVRGRAAPTTHDLRTFMHLHRCTRWATGQDVPTATLVRLLLLRGRRRDATRVLGDYLATHRRGGPPLDDALKELAAELGVAARPEDGVGVA